MKPYHKCHNTTTRNQLKFLAIKIQLDNVLFTFLI